VEKNAERERRIHKKKPGLTNWHSFSKREKRHRVLLNLLELVIKYSTATKKDVKLNDNLNNGKVIQ
jgi:hypothetical protein